MRVQVALRGEAFDKLRQRGLPSGHADEDILRPPAQALQLESFGCGRRQFGIVGKRQPLEEALDGPVFRLKGSQLVILGRPFAGGQGVLAQGEGEQVMHVVDERLVAQGGSAGFQEEVPEQCLGLRRTLETQVEACLPQLGRGSRQGVRVLTAQGLIGEQALFPVPQSLQAQGRTVAERSGELIFGVALRSLIDGQGFLVACLTQQGFRARQVIGADGAQRTRRRLRSWSGAEARGSRERLGREFVRDFGGSASMPPNGQETEDHAALEKTEDGPAQPVESMKQRGQGCRRQAWCLLLDLLAWVLGKAPGVTGIRHFPHIPQSLRNRSFLRRLSCTVNLFLRSK